MKASKSPAHLHVGLQLGTQQVSDVVAWADEQIASVAEPSIDFIELALMSNANRIDVFGQLGKLAGKYELFEVLPAVLLEAHAKLQVDPSYGPDLARSLYMIFVDCNYSVPDAFSEIGSFDDAYSLAKRGAYGTEEQAFQRLLAFTGSFYSAA